MNKKETILFISNASGGLFMFRQELLEALSANYNIVVLAKDSGHVDDLVKIGCHVLLSAIDRRGTNPINDLKLLTFYEKTIRRIKPICALTYTIKPNVYAGMVCARLNIPYIANITGLGTSIENGGILAKISVLLYKKGLRKAQCVMFQNEANRKIFLENGIVKGKTRIIPGSGVNLEKYFVEQYPDERDGIRFLFVGRVMKDKGIEELLYAFRYIYDLYPHVTIDIVGEEVEDYSTMIREAGKVVRFLGFQKDMHSFYKNCHCVVLPSYHEGTANVMLEASAIARPVITTTVPGCKETFDEGITGFGCEAKNAQSLIKAIEKFLNLTTEERKKMGLAARAKMESEYDRQLVIDAYKEEIELIEKEANK